MSKMPSKKNTLKRKGHIRPAQEKRDDDIMGTNDSSIVSKRSVCSLYFPDEPDYYAPFVGKHVRRNPLINRGYWLRMHAIEQVVRHFLEADNDKTKVVVNLGCGYDPLPFQFWHRYPSMGRKATFVDVDYPQLIERKTTRILTDSLLRKEILKTNLRSSEMPVHLRSDKYLALGCDLRDLDNLERILKEEFGESNTSILFVAEVSITYMPLADADALIKWASTIQDARFCLLEQFLPQGPEHPFAQTMLSHFNKLKTPIHAVGKYPSLQQQRTRFLERGWQTSNTTVRNLWDLWSDESFTPSALRRCLDAVEPFDEWEEFALFAGHYFLVDAQNSAFGSSAAMSMSSQVKPRDMDSAQSSSPLKVTHVATPDLAPTPRRFGSGFMLGSEIAAFHGGQGTQQRLTSIDVLRRSRETATGIQPPPTPQARMCHSITTFHLADNTPAALMVGGRKSPSQALAECWMLQHGDWHEVQQLSPARFRHSSAKITIPSPAASVQGVLIFGGKTSNNQVLDEVAVWTPNDGWQAIPVVGSRPAARFGAAICSLGPSHNRGLIIGGMQSDGTVLDDVWEFSISATPDLHVQFKDRTSDVRCHGQRNLHARFGASLVPFGQSLLLVGGVHKSEILRLSDDFLLITVGSEVIVEKVVNCLPVQWPLLVGCGITAVSEEEIVIAGGGAVCFSMGSYWNEPGYLSITRIDAPVSQPWTVSVIDSVPTKDHAEVVAIKEQAPKSLPSKRKTKGKGNPSKPRNPKENPMPTPTPIPHTPLTSPADFTTLLTTTQPAIIPSLPLGPCTTLWTLPYLSTQIGADRPVTVHTSTSPHMTFASKNFTYTKQPFGTFISSVASGAQTYLRSISSTQPNKLPTKLEDDFPTIAGDFVLPAVFEGIKDRIHSSPLRIAGPVSLWLHYDVLANLLFQIRGSKTLYLYPPSDVSHLDYPAGGSSSNTSPLTPPSPSTSSTSCQLHKTHPHIAHLSLGDVLFIPPLWSHTATPQDGHSVAVNVFFRDMEDKVYAAGRDVYGNRDIQAYENGRRDVERIGRAFRDVPRSVARFYVERLAGELAGMKVGKEKEMEEGEREGERE